MRLQGCVWVLSAALVACGGESDAGSSVGGSTTDAGTSSTSDTPGTTTSITTAGSSSTTAEPGSSSTTDASGTSTGPGAESSSSTTDDATSSSTGCTPGELDCACDEGSCVDGLECSAEDTCVAAAECEDDEFGEILTEDTAHFLGTIDDNDDNGGTVMGVLTGPDDVDWFRYDGDDVAFNNVDPFRSVTASAEVRFCKFADCPGDTQTNFPCGEGNVATTSPDGRPGCCGSPIIHVPDAVCGSTSIDDDDMAIWIRIDQAAEACVQYAFNYHY